MEKSFHKKFFIGLNSSKSQEDPFINQQNEKSKLNQAQNANNSVNQNPIECLEKKSEIFSIEPKKNNEQLEIIQNFIDIEMKVERSKSINDIKEEDFKNLDKQIIDEEVSENKEIHFFKKKS